MPGETFTDPATVREPAVAAILGEARRAHAEGFCGEDAVTHSTNTLLSLGTRLTEAEVDVATARFVAETGGWS